jgi:5-methylcytosine-specific restriction endonuclease McrA
MVRTGSGMARFIKKRDRGICALCGLDCEKISRELRQLIRNFWATWSDPDRSYGRLGRKEAALKEYLSAFRAKHGIPAHRKRRLWDIDHIIPVAEGGGSCSPENLRTLCVHCHRAETKKLMERLKLSKRQAQIAQGTPDKADVP